MHARARMHTHTKVIRFEKALLRLSLKKTQTPRFIDEMNTGKKEDTVRLSELMAQTCVYDSGAHAQYETSRHCSSCIHTLKRCTEETRHK